MPHEKTEPRRQKAQGSHPNNPVASLLGALLTVVLAFPSCSKKEAQPEPTVTVQVTPARRTTIQRKVTAEAILYPLQQAAIVAKISTPVRKFYVNRGSRVHAGQLLAVLESRDLAAAAVENKGAYDQAQASYETATRATLPEEIQKAELDVKAARDALDAAQKLYDSRKMLHDQGALPRKDLDQATVGLTQARNQYEIAYKHFQALQSFGKQQELKAAEGQLTAAKGKYLGAEAQLGYSEIRSPIDGVVTDRPLFPGEMAAPGSPLITVMDTSQVIARAHISQQESALLKVGYPASLSSSAPSVASSAAPDRSDKGSDQSDDIKGKVTVVSPALDPNSTTVEVWVQAPNPGGRFKPGTTVRVTILAETVPDALVVPASALLTTPEGETSVMVVGPDDRAHQRKVRTGIREGDDVQTAEGLQAGERVVTVGAYGLPDNTKVRIEQGSGLGARD